MDLWVSIRVWGRPFNSPLVYRKPLNKYLSFPNIEDPVTLVVKAKKDLQTKTYEKFKIITGHPLIFIMDYLAFIVSNQKEESFSI